VKSGMGKKKIRGADAGSISCVNPVGAGLLAKA